MNHPRHPRPRKPRAGLLPPRRIRRAARCLPAPPTLQIDVARRWATGTVYDGGGGGGRRPGRGERVCRRRRCGVSGSSPPPDSARVFAVANRAHRRRGARHRRSGSPPPLPPECSDEASTGLRLRGGGLTRHIERTRDRSASDGCTIPFLAYLLGMVLIKSHGPIIHLLLQVRFHPVE